MDDVKKNGYQLKLQCKDCGATFDWWALPTQLLPAKLMKPSRCPSCRRSKRDRVQKTRSPKSRPR